MQHKRFKSCAQRSRHSRSNRTGDSIFGLPLLEENVHMRHDLICNVNQRSVLRYFKTVAPVVRVVSLSQRLYASLGIHTKTHNAFISKSNELFPHYLLRLRHNGSAIAPWQRKNFARVQAVPASWPLKFPTIRQKRRIFNDAFILFCGCGPQGVVHHFAAGANAVLGGSAARRYLRSSFW